MHEIVLCGRKRGCCPTLKIEGENYIINDDYGGEVILTKENIKYLLEAVE